MAKVSWLGLGTFQSQVVCALQEIGGCVRFRRGQPVFQEGEFVEIARYRPLAAVSNYLGA